MASAYTNGESEDGEFQAVYLVAGLSDLARSSNQTHETDRRNQIDQIPTTRRSPIPLPSLPGRHEL